MPAPSRDSAISALPPLPRDGRTGHTGDRVRALLEEAILSGALPPHTHLNADRLADQLGVSHIPVREALRWLSADGWIESRPHVGARVRGHSEQELADLFEARLELEVCTAGLAAQRRSEDQLAALDEILARQARTDDPLALARINAEFHIAVAQCAQNQLLAGFVRSLSMRARFYFSTVAPDRKAESLRQHGAIVRALRHRDSSAAKTLSREHVEGTRIDVLTALGGTGHP